MFSNKRNNRHRRTRFGRRPADHDRVVQEKRDKARAREAERRKATEARKKQRGTRKRQPKPSDLKTRHTLRARRRFVLWVVLWLLLAASFLFALVSVSRHESVTIKTIEIHGLENIDRDEVEQTISLALEDEQFRIMPRRNIFAVAVGRIKRAISNDFLRVRDIEITRDYFTTLVVSIQERSPVFLACPREVQPEEPPADTEDAGCLVGDETGLLFADAKSGHPDTIETFLVSEDAPRKGDTLFEGNSVSEILSFITRVEEQGIAIEEIELDNDQTMRFKTDLEYDILTRTLGDLEEVLLNLVTAINSEHFQAELAEKDIYEVDLRFGNKVFYRFRGEVEQKTSAEEE